MSYSVLNVARLAGTRPIAEALDFEIEERELWNRIGNKHVHPTGLPATAEDAMIEWATATVAIREAVREHLEVMRGIPEQELLGPSDVNAIPSDEPERTELAGRLSVLNYDLIIGSGGILSHSPRDAAAMMLTDALAPDGRAELAVDRAFMFPHLGVLSETDPGLAKKLFFDLALVKLGTVDDARKAPSSSELAGEGFEPPGKNEPAHAEARIERGRILARRELATEGEVFVKPGDVVATDTIIARSVRQFLRPFFLSVSRALQVSPEELDGVLLKSVGDDVAKGEIIARQRRFGKPSTYRSPVKGKLEKILPDGTMVVRESPEEAQVLTTVRVAKELGVHADRLKPYLKVAVGDKLERDQWIAVKTAGGYFRTSRSPVRGKVSRIDKRFGMVMIEPLLEELEVPAWLPGTVESVTARGCTIENEGVEIYGVWGSGGEAHGLLTMGRIEPGCVVVLERADAAAIAECREAGVAGLIAGGVDLEDVLEPQLGFTLVVTGAFGASSIAEELRTVLSAHEGRLALVDGTTQLRVGVRRPRIILPSAGGAVE
ncbi:glutamate mutase L, partial [bacterium]|nr:glutamate mutase L [bacterium]